ncbi:MAG: branched-chain amino acid ABC transporter permease [Solirubrobacteraceae bacterium]
MSTATIANRGRSFKQTLGSKWGQRGLAAAVIAFAIILPQFMDSGGSWMNDLTLMLAYMVMALGLNVVVGFAGLLDLGYVAFYALGAYTVGWFASGHFNNADIHIFASEFASNLPGIHLNFLLIIPIAALVAALIGMVIGFPTLRLRGDYIAIVTLAFGEIIGRAAINGDEGVFGIGSFNLTNGKIGIQPTDRPDLPFLDPFTGLELRPWYYLALALALIVIFINLRLRDSRLGRAWIAVREDEVAAISMGIPTVKVKLLAYAIGAAMGGVSGAFLGAYLEGVNADSFLFSFSIFILAMIILGGLGSIWGVVLGAAVLSLINTRLIPDVLNPIAKDAIDFDLTQLSFGIFGFLLVIMMVLRPQGILPEKRREAELTEGLSDEPVIEVRQ